VVAVSAAKFAALGIRLRSRRVQRSNAVLSVSEACSPVVSAGGAFGFRSLDAISIFSTNTHSLGQ
jgi:hypothetical protein